MLYPSGLGQLSYERRVRSIAKTQRHDAEILQSPYNPSLFFALSSTGPGIFLGSTTGRLVGVMVMDVDAETPAAAEDEAVATDDAA